VGVRTDLSVVMKRNSINLPGYKCQPAFTLLMWNNTLIYNLHIDVKLFDQPYYIKLLMSDIPAVLKQLDTMRIGSTTFHTTCF
jgi:hypothetical protein